MAILFWTALLVVAYVYVGYPALLAVWGRLAPRPVRRSTSTPGVSIILAVRNEEAVLARRLDNLLALDYPKEQLQIVVVSDGSTDGTDRVLDRYDGRMDVIRTEPGGKALALNVGVEQARHDVLVFTDARQTFAPDAVKALVGALGDPEVGGVSGELLLDCESGQSDSSIGDGVGAYWRYEKWLRRHESLIGSTVGATGAIYALRRELWRALPPKTILDDVLAPMQAVLAGARVVFEDRARAYDHAGSVSNEVRRKTRTLAGNYQILALQPRLLIPVVNPIWVQYVSHKLGRLIVPWALLALLVSNALLVMDGAFYAFTFAGQVAFYALALCGARLEDRRLPRLSFTFVMLNWTAVAGLLALASGKRVWR
jgi:biofilm PGA synthesis N-glycosyltransferase PgaC